MQQKTIDEIAGLLMYMEDIISNDEDSDPYVYVGEKKLHFNRDYETPIIAINKFKEFTKVIEEEECWKDGKHCGDCTKVPATCMRCLVEDYRSQAARLIKKLDEGI